MESSLAAFLIKALTGQDIEVVSGEAVEIVLPGRGYNFGSGCLEYSLGNDIPEREIERLDILKERLERGRLKKGEIKRVEPVMLRMLTEETSLRPNESRIKPIHTSARGSIDYVLKRIVKPRGRVALPLPNWGFWEQLDGIKDGSYSLEYVPAWEPNQLVDSFRKLANKRNLSALLLVSPTNPLGQRLDKEVLTELDRIAQARGIRIVIDDLLRGNLPIGDRETIAANISEPYVVEGFSHRFGNGHLSELSYALVPEGDRAVSPPYKGECLCSEILDLAFRYCTKPIAEELQARNAAFDRGMRTVLPEIQITRPSNSSITSVVKLPDQMEIGSTHFAEEARINGVGVFPMSHFYPDGVQPPKVAERYFRVAVGEMDIERVEVGADYLARGMSLRMRD